MFKHVARRLSKLRTSALDFVTSNQMQYRKFTLKYVDQWFSKFIDLRHPSFVIEQLGGTPSLTLLVNRRQFHELAAPLELFTAPKGSAAPWLRTTATDVNDVDWR